MQAGVSVVFTLCQVDPLFEREGEMGGAEGPHSLQQQLLWAQRVKSCN